jgi:hypothetical protein
MPEVMEVEIYQSCALCHAGEHFIAAQAASLPGVE